MNPQQLFYLQGRAALISGASSGIGLAIAKKFADLGYDVAVNSFEAEVEIADELAAAQSESLVAFIAAT